MKVVRAARKTTQKFLNIFHHKGSFTVKIIYGFGKSFPVDIQFFSCVRRNNVL